MVDLAATLRTVERALAAGEAPAAFRALRPLLDYPGRLDDAPTWVTAMALFARVGEAIAGEEFGQLARAAIDPGNVQALYNLGYELIEQDLAPVAATVLARANAAAPGHDALMAELVAALERAGFHREAQRWLAEAPPEMMAKSFPLRYLLAWNGAMAGDLGEVRRQLPGLDAGSDEHQRAMVERLAGLVARADALAGVAPLDGDDLRGWHFVVNGGLLLHLSQHGFDEGMRGRYSFVQDSLEICREAIARLRVVLGAWGTPERVYALPDRDSAILAHAAAALLGVPLEAWSAASSAPGLIVAYDLATVEREVVAGLQAHHPGQLLWQHACRWVEDQPIAADVVTYLYQFNIAPWGERLAPGDERARRVAPDPSPPSELGARIAACAVEPGALADLDALATLARACATVGGEHAGGAFRAYGIRRRQWAGGPVLSNRFA